MGDGGVGFLEVRLLSACPAAVAQNELGALGNGSQENWMRQAVDACKPRVSTNVSDPTMGRPDELVLVFNHFDSAHVAPVVVSADHFCHCSSLTR